MEAPADRPSDKHFVLLSSPQSLVLNKYIILIMWNSWISLFTLEGKLCARLWICGILLVLWAYFLKGHSSVGHEWCLWWSGNPFLSPAAMYVEFLNCMLLYRFLHAHRYLYRVCLFETEVAVSHILESIKNGVP